MFFGLSYGEIIVITGVGVAAIGHKDFAVIAKTAGQLTGRAAGLLSVARSRFAAFTESTELTQLHNEVRGTLSQLEVIREELRRGVIVSSTSQAAFDRFSGVTAWGSEAAAPAAGAKSPTEAAQAASLVSQPLPTNAAAVPATAVPGRSLTSPQPQQQDASPEQERVVRAAPLPALSSMHFATGAASKAESVGLVGDQSFDSAAYAAYQSLFDVPAGRHAPPLGQHRGLAGSRQDAALQADPDAATQASPAGPASAAAVDPGFHQDMARSFEAFLRTPEAQRILQQAVQGAMADGRQQPP